MGWGAIPMQVGTLRRRLQAVLQSARASTQNCTLRASLYEHDVGQGMEKMGHTHDSWQGNIALGLRAIARGGRFGGVNSCAYRGSHQDYMGLQFASGADFAKSIEVWGVGL